MVNFLNDLPFLGTGWFLEQDIIVTNRHVAQLLAQWNGQKFAFSSGVGSRLPGVICWRIGLPLNSNMPVLKGGIRRRRL